MNYLILKEWTIQHQQNPNSQDPEIQVGFVDPQDWKIPLQWTYWTATWIPSAPPECLINTELKLESNSYFLI